MKSSNYLIITTRKIDGKACRHTLGENTLRTAKRVARFIVKNFQPDSIVVVNEKGKVGMYEVAGHPEKSERRMAKEMI
jgi:hypothetical protein